MEGRPLDEQALIERARRGDEEAYAELVHAYEGIAFRTAYLLTGSAADAEDAAQDGFVKAWRALGRFRAGSPFKPWLLRIVAAVKMRRKARSDHPVRGDPIASVGRISLGEMTAAEATLRDEASLIEAWRAEELERAGYTASEAAEIATRPDVDLHAATDLLARGCPSPLALRILL